MCVAFLTLYGNVLLNPLFSRLFSLILILDYWQLCLPLYFFLLHTTTNPTTITTAAVTKSTAPTSPPTAPPITPLELEETLEVGVSWSAVPPITPLELEERLEVEVSWCVVPPITPLELEETLVQEVGVSWSVVPLSSGFVAVVMSSSVAAALVLNCCKFYRSTSCTYHDFMCFASLFKLAPSCPGEEVSVMIRAGSKGGSLGSEDPPCTGYCMHPRMQTLMISSCKVHVLLV